MFSISLLLTNFKIDTYILFLYFLHLASPVSYLTSKPTKYYVRKSHPSSLPLSVFNLYESKFLPLNSVPLSPCNYHVLVNLAKLMFEFNFKECFVISWVAIRWPHEVNHFQCLSLPYLTQLILVSIFSSQSSKYCC